MSDLGIHILTGEMLLEMLRRVQEGEDADLVYMSVYANAQHIEMGEEDE